MKDMFEKIRVDKNFNLETLSFEEIFNGIKDGVAKTLSKFTKQDVRVEDLVLNLDRCSKRFAYGEDANLYPKIYLDLKGFYSVLLNPFEIDLVETKQRIRIISCEELKETLYNFMRKQFPESDYDKKYDKYFLDAEKLRKVDELFICN